MIQLNNISLNYGEVSALKDISFEVERGEIFGLIGPDVRVRQRYSAL